MNKSKGFTLTEITIVVAIIGLLAAIAIPNFVAARNANQQNACIRNLNQIQGAKTTWALENSKIGTAVPTDRDLFGMTQYVRSKPLCPAGGTYTLGAVNQDPQCSYVNEKRPHALASTGR